MSKEKIIKFQGPKGEVELSEEEIKLLFNVTSTYLDLYIDDEWNQIDDYYHTALTHKDPEIMKSYGSNWHHLSDATQIQKLIDERFWKKPYHYNDHRFESAEIKNDKEVN